MSNETTTKYMASHFSHSFYKRDNFSTLYGLLGPLV